jgi:hypothetical protein
MPPARVALLALLLAACTRPPPLGREDLGKPRAAAGDSEVRRVVSLGRDGGFASSTVAADGTRELVLDVLENGRGPHVDATLKIAPDGTPAAFTAKGHHTMGTEIDESFTREGTRARWHSREERGDRNVTGPAFYVPIAPSPDVLGQLAVALLRHGGRLDLLPAGEARIEPTAEVTVFSAAGESRRLSGYAIHGLDLTPAHVWMNPDGTWFGTASPWQSVIPAGFEPGIDALVAAQDRHDRERSAALARAHAQLLRPAGLAYTHARVLDVAAGAWLADHTVVVVGDEITAVGPSPTTAAPPGAEVVDLAGKAVLPGLWDMHVHLGETDGPLHIASGVTTVRDVGNDPDKLDDLKRRWDAGTAVGPRVLRYGFIEGRGDKAASSKVTAETEPEARDAVALFAARGYDGIKIYNSVRPELVPLLAREAHARGMQVIGHIPVHMLAHEAVAAGYDGIEHINMLFLNFLADHETDTRTTQRFTLVGERGADLDLRGAPAREFFALLRERGTVVDPTVGVFQQLLLARQGELVPGTEAMVARLPLQTQRGYRTGGLPLADKADRYAAAFANVLAMIKRLDEEGVTLVVGTDDLAGLSLHRELALYVRAGLSPAAALRMATLVAARTMKQDATSGSIAPGKRADLFVVDGDPLADITDIGKIVSTLRGGTLYPSAPLYQSVGVQPGIVACKKCQAAAGTATTGR